MAYDDGYGQGQVQLQLPPFRGWVKKLILINAGIFLAHFVLGFFSKPAQFWITQHLGLVPPQWAGLPPLWQPITSGFLHSLRDPMHIGFNMLTLYFFGEMVQSAIGSKRFLGHYLVAMVVGAAAHLMLAPLMGWTVPVVGASGACMGMVVAAAVLAPDTPVIFFIVRLKLWILAAFFVAVDVFFFLSELQGEPMRGIAHTVHLGGAAYGYFAAKKRWLYKDPLKLVGAPLQALQRKRAVKSMQRSIGDDARMDEILAKIDREGIGSVTKSERSFMQRVSERKKSG